MSKTTKNKENNLSKAENQKYVKVFWKVIFGIVAFGFLFMLAVALGVFGKLPSMQALENPDNNFAAEIWSADGQMIGTFYEENRSYVSYEDISPNVIKALVSTEDKRFYQHSGIDFKRTFASVVFTLFGDKQGGSTITQQLALNLYDERASNFFMRIMQKFREYITAIRLERRYTKREIITMYLNTVNFGSNSYGVKMAARTFFDTTPDKLTVPQAALLVGVVNAPTRYSPTRNPKNSIERRNVVLLTMLNNEEINEKQYKQYIAAPLKLDLQPTHHDEGPAPYFRAFLRKSVQNMIDEGEIPAKESGKKYNVYTDGLKIYTTINSRMQRYAEEAVQEHLSDLQKQFYRHWKGRGTPWKYSMRRDNLGNGDNPVFDKEAATINTAIKRSNRYRAMAENKKSDEQIKAAFEKPVSMKVFTWDQKDLEKDTVMSPLDSVIYYKWFLRSSLLSIEPQTGYVRAWVGGPDFRYFKYDMVHTGKRQVGSTFKPIVYAEAIENYAFSPCTYVPNIPVTFPKFNNYTPQNSDHSVGGIVTLRAGLAKSMNVITAYLVKEIGPKSIINRAKKMGIGADFKPYPSIGLGVFETTLYDMVAAYSSIINQGMHIDPIYITRIEDSNGNIIYNKVTPPSEAMSEQTAYTMLYMLRGTSEMAGGTAMRLRTRYNFKNPIAAKTGTTQRQVDGWFMGAVPNLVTGIWTGGSDQTVRWTSIALGQGANASLPTWGIYMKKIYADPILSEVVSKGQFEQPSDPSVKTSFDCSLYSPNIMPVEGGGNVDSTYVDPESRLDF